MITDPTRARTPGPSAFVSRVPACDSGAVLLGAANISERTLTRHRSPVACMISSKSDPALSRPPPEWLILQRTPRLVVHNAQVTAIRVAPTIAELSTVFATTLDPALMIVKLAAGSPPGKGGGCPLGVCDFLVGQGLAALVSRPGRVRWWMAADTDHSGRAMGLR